MSLRLAAALLLGLTASSTAAAQDRQFRNLELTDGRTLTAEILATEATGLRVRTVQGDSLISFEVLRDMAPSDAASYGGQEPWVVYVAANANYKSDVLAMFNSIEGIEARPVGTEHAGITAEMAAEAVACEAELSCIAGAIKSSSWKWVVTVDDEVMRSMVSMGTSQTRIEVDADRTELWQQIHEAISLARVSDPVPESISVSKGSRVRDPGVWDEARVMRASFAPLPGMPSMKQGDGAGVGKAWAIVLPTTAAFAAGGIASAGSAPELVGIVAAGFYGSTVMANQITGMGSLKKARASAMVLPSPHGAQITVAGSF